MAPTADQVASLRSTWEAANQGHVLHFWDKLNSDEQSALYDQLASLDPDWCNVIVKKALEAASETTSDADSELTPPPEGTFDSTIEKNPHVKEWNDLGLSAMAKGEVGILLLAGGQGTRLGSSAPKGCYDIGLPSSKSLFQLQAERIAKLHELAGGKATIPWYIMTSGPTREPTEKFFKENKFFGLKEDNVVFFEQGVLPCFDNSSKVLLDKPGTVAVAPGGNGGIYPALRAPLGGSRGSSSVISDLRSRGVKYVHAYGVDNCLVRVGDPVFIGYSISKQAQCGVKVVRKAYATESVGVVCQKGGKWAVVEYSEIPKELSERKDESGQLTFRAANIANHFYTTDFLEKVGEFEKDMAYHVANKKIPHVEIPSGKQVKPTSPNGVKLELFIFDVFPFVPTPALSVLEVARQDDFSPLKNAPGTGSDDPGTSRRDLLAAFTRWIEAAGGEVASGVEVEISPLVSYAGEGLEALKGKKIAKSGLVEKKEDWEKVFA